MPLAARRPSLLRAFAAVGGWTLASRILGLVRDIVVAAVFGAGPAADAFFAAFRLPNLLRRFTAEGALTQGFVPVYNAARRDPGNPGRAAALANEAAGLLAAALLLLVGLGMLFAPQVMRLVAPGLTAPPELSAALLRLTLPYILLVSLVALAAGVLNSLGRFAAPAAAPVLFNLALIAAALFLAPLLTVPIHALAWGVLLGGIFQLALVAFALQKNRALPKPVVQFPPSPDARKILTMMGQSALAGGAAQINLLINLAIASLLAQGSISWLYYADRLMELPAGLLGAALATVALPALSRQANDPAAFSRTLDQTLRIVVFLAVPAAAGLVIMAEPLVHAVFLRGQFSPEDAAQTARAVAAYGLGVVGLVAARPLAAACFAKQDAATPVKIAVASLLAAQAMNALFILGLGLAHAGLALSVGLAATLNAAMLLTVLLRRKWLVPRGEWRALLLRVLAAVLVMTAVLKMGMTGEPFWQTPDDWTRAAKTIAWVGAGMTAYFAAAFLFGARPAHFRPQNEN